MALLHNVSAVKKCLIINIHAWDTVKYEVLHNADKQL